MENRIDQRSETVRRLLDDRLHIRGRSLAHQTRKAGRRLPRRVRSDLTFATQAQEMLSHPKLRLMVDEGKVEAALDRAATFLKSVDPLERRKDRLLGIAGSAAFSLLAVAGLVIGVLIWRGFV